MRSLFHDFYVQPMNTVYIETVAMYLIWTVAMLLLRGKARKILSFKHLEFYRSMFMNVLLFMPFGLSMPFALPNRFKHKALLSIFFGAILSMTVEACQYIFFLGRCETDDVIMNTLGVAIGATSFLIFLIVIKIKLANK